MPPTTPSPAIRSRCVSRSSRLSLRALGLLLGLLAAPASAQLRVANYNIAQIRGDTHALQEVFSALALDDRPGFAMPPALICMQEVRAVDRPILEALVAAAIPGATYATATFTTSAFEDGNGGAQLLLYRSDLFTEIVADHEDLPTGAGRNSDRWHLQLSDYDSPAAGIWVYSTHLKAGGTGADASARLEGAQTLRADADALPAGSHVLFLGDFNFASSSEAAYQHFLGAGPAQCVDPLGSGSWSGAGNAMKHSQSPRDISADGLTGGGMNDRFDLQLPSSAWHDDDGLALMPGTYRALGNDGLHYNLAINAGNNVYWPGNVAASNALADDLFDASDHIPVVAEYQVPAVMSAIMAEDFGRVIQNRPATVEVLIANIASSVVPGGAALLHYDVTGLEGLGGPISGSIGGLPDVAVVDLPIDTGAVGFLQGIATVTTTSEGAQFPFYLLFTSGQVLRAANPSFSFVEDVDVAEFEFAFQRGSGVHSASIAIANLGFDAEQALLDVDSVSGTESPLSILLPLPSGIGAGEGMIQLEIDTSVPPGTYGAALTIVCSDEDIQGATTSLIGALVSVIIEEAGVPADLNGDGVVDGADLGTLLASWGPCDGCPADLNDDGAVDGADLGTLLAAWG
jgi:endonuclease/exonuclease/phosphatase family metal-dependent hydrolase